MNKNSPPSESDATLIKLLFRKCAKLATRLCTLRTQTSEIESALASIDDTLSKIRPAVLPIALSQDPRPTQTAPLFAKGECLALMKQILSESYQPLIRIELVRAVMARTGLPDSDELRVRTTVSNILRSGAAATAGIVATDPKAQYPRWTLRR